MLTHFILHQPTAFDFQESTSKQSIFTIDTKNKRYARPYIGKNRKPFC